MSKNERLFPLVVPAERQSDTNTHLKVQVLYRKGYGIILRIGPVGLKTFGGVSMEITDCFTAASYVLEDAKRLNAKRVDAVAADTLDAVASKVGPAWTKVSDFLRGNGWELADDAAPQAVAS